MSETSQQPCEACGDANPRNGTAGVWGSLLCYPCINAWDAVAPTPDEAEQKYPKDEDRFRAYTEFTKSWVARRRSRAA